MTFHGMSPVRRVALTLLAALGSIAPCATTFIRPAVSGRQLLLSGEPFELRSVAYSPTPIGLDPNTGATGATTDTSFLQRDGPLLRAAGFNAIRIYGALGMRTDGTYGFGTATAWLQEAANQGLWVIMGTYIPPVLDFANASVRSQVRAAHTAMRNQFGSEPNVLMWVIGNEVNMSTPNPDAYYTLMELVAQDFKAAQGPGGPLVSVVNGDAGPGVTYGASLAPSVDVWGANIYRGSNFGDLFTRIQADLTTPFWISECGIDAWHFTGTGSPPGAEDQATQADFAQTLWFLLRRQSTLVSGGDFGFYPDEWWKSVIGGSPATPSVHDYGGGAFGGAPDNHTTEEWLGIAAIGPGSPNTVTPREAMRRGQAIFVGGLQGPAPLRADFNLSSANNFGGFGFGFYGGGQFQDDSLLPVTNGATGFSGATGDRAMRANATLPIQTSFTFFGAVSPLHRGGNIGLDFSQGFDRLSFDVRLGTDGAHANWIVRLEDDDTGDEFNNTSAALPTLTTAWQHLDIPLSSFTGGARPVSLDRLRQVVFASSNAPSGSGTVTVDLLVDNLTITGPPNLSAVPASLAYTYDPVNPTAPQTRTLDLYNIGSRPLSITGLGITGTGAANYTLVSPPALPQSVAFGALLTVQVRYDPQGDAAAPAQLQINSDAPGETLTSIPLSADPLPVGLSGLWTN